MNLRYLSTPIYLAGSSFAFAQSSPPPSGSPVEMDDFVVVAPHLEGSLSSLNEERKSSAAVSEVVGSEQISKAGDGTAAAALRRVSGLTLVGGKYIYVRGLGERYSSTLFNGATLPSPEPSRRVVPLDIFPTGILESVTVQKTYTPDLPGEFGGGVISLRSKGVPEKRTLQSSVSLGYRSGTTLGEGKTYVGGKLDSLGFDDGSRTLPRDIRNSKIITEKTQANPGGYSESQLERLGELLPNRYSLTRATPPPDLSLSLGAGDRIMLSPGRTLGASASLMYTSAWEVGESLEVDYADPQRNGKLEAAKQFTTQFTDNKIRLGAIANLGAQLGEEHRFNLVSTLVRNTKKSALEAQGFNMAEGDNTEIRKTRLRWQENVLLVEQLQGSHMLAGDKEFLLNWNYTFSQALAGEPNRRSYTHAFVNRDWQLRTLPERTDSNLGDQNHDASASVSIPLYADDTLRVNIFTGGGYVERRRSSELRRFKWTGGSGVVWKQPLEEVFSKGNIGSGAQQFQLEESTVNTDSYKAKQSLGSAHAQLEFHWREWKTAAGTRLESSRQEVSTTDLHSAAGDAVKAALHTTTLMPSASLTWQRFENMPVRLSYSRTVARPDFKELSPAPFWDDRNDSMTRGNPKLKQTTIHNFDTRWEWYLSPLESVSIGLFHKEFVDPVEVFQTGALDGALSFRNVTGSRNSGLEWDGRKELSFLSGWLKGFSLGGNVAFIRSRVRLGKSDNATGDYQTSDNRPLQGQSPYVANLNLEYENSEWGLTSSLLYNVNGERIVELGASGEPDVLEQPAHMLDLVTTQKIGPGLSLKVQIKNLLAAGSKSLQGSKVAYREDGALSASVGLNGSF